MAGGSLLLLFQLLLLLFCLWFCLLLLLMLFCFCLFVFLGGGGNPVEHKLAAFTQESGGVELGLCSYLGPSQ